MGLKRFVFLTDTHGDMQCSAAVNAALGFVRDFKPHYKICGGDVFDLRAWRTKAGPKEQDEDTEADLAAGMSFLRAYRPTHYLRGNHCERIWDRIEDAQDGRVRNYAKRIAEEITSLTDGMACVMLPYHKRRGVLRIGHLKFVHGYGNGGINAARQHALAYGCCMLGHVHTRDEASIPHIDRVAAWTTGGLCQLDFPYNRATLASLRHCHGWGYGTIDDKTGHFAAFQAEGIDGKFYVATDVRAVA